MKIFTFQVYSIFFRPIWWTCITLWSLVLFLTATNTSSSSNCNPIETWFWDMLLVCLCVVSCATLGSFSFNIVIIVCLRWLVLVKEKSYTSISTESSVRVHILGTFFFLHFLLVPSASLTISKENFLVNASGEDVCYQWTTVDLRWLLCSFFIISRILATQNGWSNSLSPTNVAINILTYSSCKFPCHIASIVSDILGPT